MEGRSRSARMATKGPMPESRLPAFDPMSSTRCPGPRFASISCTVLFYQELKRYAAACQSTMSCAWLYAAYDSACVAAHRQDGLSQSISLAPAPTILVRRSFWCADRNPRATRDAALSRQSSALGERLSADWARLREPDPSARPGYGDRDRADASCARLRVRLWAHYFLA